MTIDVGRFVFGAFIPALLVLALLLLIPALSELPWLAPDWENIYRPGALSSHPNDVRGNFAPPWTYLALHPLAMLPDNMSKGVLTLATMTVCIFYLKGDRRKIIALCLTMPFLATVAFGQVDAMSLIGLMVPAELSLLFLSMKPQGAALAALKGRLNLTSVCWFLAVLAGSFILWGWWPDAILQRGAWGTNCSLWPYSIPFSLGLLYWQWKRGFDSDAALCLATVLLTPYFFVTSLLPVTAAAIKELGDDWLCVAGVVVLTWAFGAVWMSGL